MVTALRFAAGTMSGFLHGSQRGNQWGFAQNRELGHARRCSVFFSCLIDIGWFGRDCFYYRRIKWKNDAADELQPIIHEIVLLEGIGIRMKYCYY